MPSLEEAMRQSEDSIEQLDDGLITPVNDVFMINPETRIIEVPESERLFGVNFDKDVEKKYFKCPKIVGNNIDLSKHKIYVVYQKANKNITTLMKGDIVDVKGKKDKRVKKSEECTGAEFKRCT